MPPHVLHIAWILFVMFADNGKMGSDDQVQERHQKTGQDDPQAAAATVC